MANIRLKLLIIIAILLTIINLIRIQFVEDNSSHFSRIQDEVNFINSAEEKVQPKLQNVETHFYNNTFDQILFVNYQQEIYNTDKFGQHTNNSLIIALQYDGNLEHLKMFIQSLENVKGIEKATLVISSSDNPNKISEVLTKITFCRYMQIIFPFSMEFFPNSFPGEDPNDCPRNILKHEAIAKNCNNAYFPDMYGHYREVKFVQLKHHWLWKLGMLVHGIKIFKEKLAPILLLEASNYLLPDLLNCASKAISLKVEKCPKCGFVNLGNRLPSQNSASSDQVELIPWTSGRSTSGMLVTPDALGKIFDGLDIMCEFDDYNWGLSLQHLLSSKLIDISFTLQFKTTRVFHLGSCLGMRTSNCPLDDEVKYIKNQFKNKSLFPDSLKIISQTHKSPAPVKPNGGWGDLRDQSLCKKYKLL